MVLSLCATGTLLGQEAAQPQQPAGGYRELSVNSSKRLLLNKIKPLLREGDFGEKEEALFDDYFYRCAFPEWSLVAKRADLVNLRHRHRILLKNAKNPPAHKYLNKITLNFMSILASTEKGNFHPASRVNAMLLIGELNDVEDSKAPRPMTAALPKLIATVNDPKQLDAVKVAAIVGIIRHGQSKAITTPGARSAVGRPMLNLVQSKTADAWMRGQAAEVLGMLGSAAVAKDLAAMAGDSSLLFSARCTAARALGRLNYRATRGVKADELAAALRQLLVDAVNAETRAVSRRRLKARVMAVSTGLKRVATIVPSPPAVASLATAVAAILGDVNNQDLTDSEMIMKIKEEADKLK